VTTLSDGDLLKEISKNRLIKGADSSLCTGASYELRLSDVYYDLTESDHPIQVGAGEAILIKPGHHVVLITKESLDVPADLVGRVVCKGSLFSIGLSHVATYADPGFAGNLGIVTHNISDKFILLPQGEPIAKIDFTQLSSPAKNLYQGQHGFRTQIWPIKHHLQKTYEQVKDDRRMGTEREEAYRLLPKATAELLKKLDRRHRVLDAGILGVVVLNALAIFLVNQQMISQLQSLVSNLVASAIWVVAAFYVGRKG
jgi:dCTP deaminase